MRAEIHQRRGIMPEAPRSSASTLAPNSAVDQPIRQSDKRVIQTLLWALKPLFNLRGTRSIPLSYAIVFLTVALDEGKSVGGYARALGIKNRLTMSRFLKSIGPRGRNGGPRLGLIRSKPDPSVYQGTQIFLTAKGRKIADAVFGQLERLCGPGD